MDLLLQATEAVRDIASVRTVSLCSDDERLERAMRETNLTTGVVGKTIRFSWTDGPTKGSKHDHMFHEDGTVEWHRADEGDSRQNVPKKEGERPKFLDEGIATGVRLVSYLSSSSGYTLTVVLNENDGHIVGVASNDKIWTPVRGSFEVIATPEAPPG